VERSGRPVPLAAAGSPTPNLHLPAATPASRQVASAASSSAVSTVPVVPVVGFWSAQRSITRDSLAAAVAGTDRTFRRVVVRARDLAPLTAALGVRAGPVVTRPTASGVLDAVHGTTDVIAVIPAADVDPSVRALAVDGRSLFGNARVRSLADWPLAIPAPSPSVGEGSDTTFDPTTAWTLVAAGDVMNDREVHRRAVLLGAGPDYPWDGGTARVASRSCCRVGLTTVTAERTGHTGAVRDMFTDADVSLVNHEGPAPDSHTYHPRGLVFTFDPALEAGIRDAGVDIVSLANNHIRNGGSDGVVETIRNVEAAGLKSVGAGMDKATARRPVTMTVNGVHVAFLAYDAVNLAVAGATASRPGAAPFDVDEVRADIRSARTAGADVVIVVAHWGVEYTDRPTTLQRRQAAALIAAGADVIVGSHPHWAGAIEAVGDGVVLYSLGDFIFDLPRSEQTEEGVIVELTFAGPRVAQIDLHPTIELDRSQPNLLGTYDAKVVLDRIRKASGERLGW
jgi:poly-gamma-glutamate capsule biosynthesis protein CapA/YwtB (metallophosphatase superfamily)